MHRTLREISLKKLGALLVLLLCSALALFSPHGLAGQERYDYDPIGRLVRHIDSNNQVTDYTYDAAGNLLSVNRSGLASGLAPVLTAIAPGAIRRGETKTITLTGQRLQLGTLQASDPALELSNVQRSATQITASLSVALLAATGTQTFTFTNSAGAAHIAMLVAPALPVLTVEPSPLALPPDNTARAITLRLSGPDVVAHTLSLASSDVSRATVNPASVVLAAGQTVAQVSITPKLAGFVNLVLTSATLRSVTVPVFVTLDFRGVNTSYAAPVGVRVGDAPGPSSPPTASATFASSRVGVAVGPVLTGISPGAMVVGGAQSFVLTGSNLPGTVQVAIQPSAGITPAAVSFVSAGSQISVALGVDAGAAVGARRIVVTDATGQLIPFADEGKSQIVLTTGQPSIASIEPLFAPQGSTVLLKIRGRHLHNGRLLITPLTDMRIDSMATINADGTELLARVEVAALAAPGPRLVQVQTFSGVSSNQPSAANQFSVVREVQHSVAPILSPLVGVVVGSAGSASTTTVGPVQAANVGVLVGAAAIAVSPPVGLLGSSLTLVVSGAGLQSVQTATLAPLDGLAVGAFSVNAEGTQLSIPLAIDASAPRTARQVVLATVAGKLAFSTQGGDQFRVVAAAPQLIAVAPQAVAAGSAVTMTLRGQNFSDVQAIQFDPPAGMVAAPPFVASQNNTVLSFGVQVSAGAVSGTRTVVVVAAGGASSAVPSPANTFQVGQQLGAVRDAIVAPQVGVLVGSSAPAPTTQTVATYAPAVGVMVTGTATQATRDESAYAPHVGVVVGVASTGLVPRSPDGFLKGGSGGLVITGVNLDQVSSVTVLGSAGVTLGALAVNGGNTQLTVPVSVSGTAASGTYGVRLHSGSGTTTAVVTAVNPGAMRFSVGALPTQMESVSPIVLEQGKSYTFTVRGTGLQDVYQVEASPGTGLRIGVAFSAPLWSTDALGEKLTVPVFVEADAPVGSRVLRLRVPGGVTDADATPANTITITTPF